MGHVLNSLGYVPPQQYSLRLAFHESQTFQYSQCVSLSCMLRIQSLYLQEEAWARTLVGLDIAEWE